MGFGREDKLFDEQGNQIGVAPSYGYDGKHRAGKKHGPALVHDRSPISPVPPETPISIWRTYASDPIPTGYWVPTTAGSANWSDVRYYRLRYPNGQPTAQPATDVRCQIPVPTNMHEAHAMLAVAKDWLDRYHGA